jgi:DNA invertase Pin-like site-specific DNA recombinase
MLTLLGGIAQFEREMMLERQKEGVAKAKAAGRYKALAKLPYTGFWRTTKTKPYWQQVTRARTPSLFY